MLRGVALVVDAVITTPEPARAEGSRPGRWLVEAIARQQGGTFLWRPIALTVGRWAYIALETEPSVVVAGIVASVSAVLVCLGRSTPIGLVAALNGAGFGLAK